MVKGFKYNFILFSLIIIIGFVVGTSNGFMLSPKQDDEIDIPAEEVPVEDDNNTPIPDGLTPPALDANAFERIDFALKVIEEGKGFQSVISQDIFSAGVNQRIFIKQYRGEGLNLYEQWLDANMSMAMFGFFSYYSDGSTVKYKKISNNANYSFQNRTYQYEKADEFQTYPASEYIKQFKNLNDIPLTINQNTTSLVKYDKRTDPDYYIIKLNFNISFIDTEYANTFKANGTGDVHFTSLVLTLKISKKTGFLARVERDETFQTKFAGIPVSCSSKAVQTYSGMNISQKAKIQEIYNKSFAHLK